MITLKHRTTGDVQFVESLTGIDLAVWEATGETVPADLAEQPYRDVGGTITKVTPPPTFRESLLALLVAKNVITQAEADALPGL